MQASGLNSLYTRYIACAATGLDPLLSAVRSIALSKLRDEDYAQSFLIEVWQSLPIQTTSFSAWLRTRLDWRVQDYRKKRYYLTEHEQQAPELFDDDGEPLSDEDSLSILAYRHLQTTGQLSEDVEEGSKALNVGSIGDLLIRETAELILLGLTQKQIADRLGIRPGNLRQKLFRYRQALPDSLMPLAA